MLEPNTLHCGDCLELAKGIPDNTFDSFVTDPPYGLRFMGKDWDHGVPGVHFWQEFLRVAKPGAHLLAFGGTRTHHRLMVAIEDAGWEIRDTLMWVYGSGFPKSLDVSKAIDTAAGVEREVVGQREDILKKQSADLIRGSRKIAESFNAGAPERNNGFTTVSANVTAPATDAAKQWDGWGTTLKPAWEPIILCRKPLEGTVVQNVLKWDVGGINIGECRVEGSVTTNPPVRNAQGFKSNGLIQGETGKGVVSQGRFPANLIHDGSDEVLALFPESKGQCGDVRAGIKKQPYNCFGDYGQTTEMIKRGGNGSSARFFYCARASRSERGEGNIHPTVKPLALMRYLCRLITPPNGIVCDPFVGSGSTALAARSEGFRYVGIDKDQSFINIAVARLARAIS